MPTHMIENFPCVKDTYTIKRLPRFSNTWIAKVAVVGVIASEWMSFSNGSRNWQAEEADDRAQKENEQPFWMVWKDDGFTVYT